MSRPIALYYAATILFLLLDFAVGVNVRVAFLEPFPTARLAYYIICFVLLALMLWRPGWAVVIGVVESLTALVALIFTMALRVMIVTDEMIETGRGFVTMEEMSNYMIAASVAYWSYNRGIRRVKELKSEERDNW